MKKKLVIIIGAMKSGTSSLFWYLTQHPEIVGANPSEPNFFGDPQKWAKGPDWYDGLFDWGPSSRCFGMEKTVAYSMWPSFAKVFERMASLRDRYDFKFIYTLRHPIERTESHLTHANARDWVHWTDSPNGIVRSCELVNVSRYALQLDQLTTHFDREQVHLVDFARIKGDPDALIAEVLDFIGVEDADAPIDTQRAYNRSENLFKGDYPPGWKVLRRVAPIKHLWRAAVPLETRQAVHRALRGTPDRVQLTEEEKRHLWGTLQDDMARLEQEWGFDTSVWAPPAWWGQARQVPYGDASKVY